MGCYWFQGGARTKSWNDILIFLAMLCIIPACSSLIYTLIQVMQQVSQTLSCMMQWSFNLKWEFCQIFILVVSLVNCCRLQHVFYPRITGINHDLMLRLNSYRQAIYSWLACSILCKNTVTVCFSLLASAFAYWQLPFALVFTVAFTFACHSHTRTLIHLWVTGRGKQSCAWQKKPAFKHHLCWFCFNMKFFIAQMQVKYKVMCSYYFIKMMWISQFRWDFLSGFS